jgi:RNA polymerase sigma factor FliA
VDRLTPQQRDVVERNLPLVEHIVKRLMARFPSSYDRDDLVQTGIMGLIEGSSRFDPTKGIAFSTFVGRRIEGAIIDQLRRDDWAPRSVRAGERRLEQAEAELTARRGTRPDERELGASVGMDVHEVRRLRARIATASVDSLDRPLGRDDGAASLSETVADTAGLGVEGELDERELRGYLRDALSLLPERHRLIVVGHFFEGRSMTELGELLGVTQSRASQLKEDALRLIRNAVRAQYLEQEETDHRTRREQAYTESLRQAKPWRERILPAGSALVG